MMHRDRTLVTTGAIGATVAAICCATPLLAVLLGALGLTAWLAKADYVLIPALLICLAMVGVGLYRRNAAQACCDPADPPKAASHERLLHSKAREQEI